METPKRNFFIFHETKTLKKFLYFWKQNFPSSKNAKDPLLKSFYIFQEIKLSSHKIRNFLILEEEIPKPEKQTKKSAQKTFLVFLLHKI